MRKTKQATKPTTHTELTTAAAGLQRARSARSEVDGHPLREVCSVGLPPPPPKSSGIETPRGAARSKRSRPPDGRGGSDGGPSRGPSSSVAAAAAAAAVVSSVGAWFCCLFWFPHHRSFCAAFLTSVFSTRRFVVGRYCCFPCR